MQQPWKERGQQPAGSTRQEVDGLCRRIEQGLEELRQSEKYLAYLRVMSRFHTYSYANAMLIMKQCPDATHVAGFSQWKKLGRYVRKQEHGIRILAPLVVRRSDDSHADAPPSPCIAGFRPVSVFDVSQTDGEPLPKLAVPLRGDVDGFDALFDALVVSQGADVRFGPLRDGASGCWDRRTGTITVREGMEQAQTLKALVHELAHMRMHPPGSTLPQPVREIQAESVAYVTCAHFGLDTKDYSFGYLESWLEEYDRGLLKQSLGGVASHAHAIIAGTETALERARNLTLDQDRIQSGRRQGRSATPMER